MYKYGIVVIGYKNAKSVKRLLDALSMAEYEGEAVKLIISIDKSDHDDVKKIADVFEWKFGDKHVINYPERLGLRDHVLCCGDYLNTYDLDALVVFEDDMMPARSFFQFTMAATEKYIENENIAGVSLYTNCINFNVMERFIPIKNDGDNFFIQTSQSRGQIWFKRQWNEFRGWYDLQTSFEESDFLPRRVASWPETSWKKYHIKYCVVKNKYFAFPYTSFSTCFGEAGEHVKKQCNDLQVPLSNTRINSFDLIDFDDKALKYDAFFENLNLYLYCDVEKNDLLVDLYGDHMVTDKKYVLTKKKLPYRVIKSWGNKLVPQEMNIMYDISGDEILLYETAEDGKMVKLPERIVEKDKMEKYFDILDRWMSIEDRGLSIGDFFVQNHWDHIAIYGYGKIGKHLYARLNNTSVKVDYFIDQNENVEEKDIIVRKLNDDLPSVDVIVVTPVLEFDNISEYLHKKECLFRVVSIEDILNTGTICKCADPLNIG